MSVSIRRAGLGRSFTRFAPITHSRPLLSPSERFYWIVYFQIVFMFAAILSSDCFLIGYYKLTVFAYILI